MSSAAISSQRSPGAGAAVASRAAARRELEVRRARAAGASRASAPAAAGGRVITAKWASASSASGSRHGRARRRRRQPTTKTGGRARAARRACAMYRPSRTGPPRSSSSASTAKRGLPAVASAHPGEPQRAPARSGRDRSRLCGGSRRGTNSMRSRPSASRTSSAARRWPRWIGLKVPPKMPIRAARLRSSAHSRSWPSPLEHELVRGETLEAHRAEGVEPRGGDADLGAEPQPVAVGESRRAVDADGRRSSRGAGSACALA